MEQQALVVKDIAIETQHVKVKASGMSSILLISLAFIALLFFIDRRWPHLKHHITKRKKK